MIELKVIRGRLREAILQSGMTQTAIAAHLGIQPTQICSYIKGRKLPALDTLANLCKLLDLDANYVLGLTNM